MCDQYVNFVPGIHVVFYKTY